MDIIIAICELNVSMRHTILACLFVGKEFSKSNMLKNEPARGRRDPSGTHATGGSRTATRKSRPFMGRLSFPC